MPIGRMRNRVTFQSETRVADEGGGYSVTWSGDLERWAEFLPERGRERIEAGRLAAPVSGTLRVRWSSAAAALTTQNRVLIDDEPYNISSAENEDRRRRYITFVVEKNVAT